MGEELDPQTKRAGRVLLVLFVVLMVVLLWMHNRDTQKKLDTERYINDVLTDTSPERAGERAKFEALTRERDRLEKEAHVKPGSDD
jgi:hypothetical protein